MRNEIIKLSDRAVGEGKDRRNGKTASKKPSQQSKPVASLTDYAESRGGMTWLKGNIDLQLTNFTAQVVYQVTIDDGLDTKRRFDIEATLKGRTHHFSVPSERFGEVRSWAMEHMGIDARVEAGPNNAAHAAAAIQCRSTGASTRKVYAHTGWTVIDGKWAFLHAGGAIGPDGNLPGVEVELPSALAPLRLPPTNGEPDPEAIRCSLSIAELLGDLGIMLLGAIYRAPLGPCRFTLWLRGATGVGKSEVAALAQQHYGAGFDAMNLPGSFSSTPGALREGLFIAKDCLHSIDDFKPEGSANDRDRMYATGNAIVRAQGNGAARDRLNRDSSLRDGHPPRGLVLATGEEFLKEPSAQARCVAIEVIKGAVPLDERLEVLQDKARSGVLASAMAGYVRWLAPRYEALTEGGELQNTVRQSRKAMRGGGLHARTPVAVADLGVGFHTLLDYASDSGAISPAEKEQWTRRAADAAVRISQEQLASQRAADPVNQFISYIKTAITTGRAHLASSDGTKLDSPRFGRDGTKIGWVNGSGDREEVCLHPGAALAAVEEEAKRVRLPFERTELDLGRRLDQAGLLLREEKRGALKGRRRLEGVDQRVWVIPGEKFRTLP